MIFVEDKQGTRNWAETIIDITRSVYLTNTTFLLTKHREEFLCTFFSSFLTCYFFCRRRNGIECERPREKWECCVIDTHLCECLCYNLIIEYFSTCSCLMDFFLLFSRILVPFCSFPSVQKKITHTFLKSVTGILINAFYMAAKSEQRTFVKCTINIAFFNLFLSAALPCHFMLHITAVKRQKSIELLKFHFEWEMHKIK